MEKAILVGLQLPGTKFTETENSLNELMRLTETAGAKPEEIFVQKRQKIDPAYLIGEGKAAEIKDIVAQRDIHTVIFDEDLKPVQQKNLEELTGAKIIDRTRLILDIFAQRARSREGILQVERAQLAYYLPRLSKKGSQLDSQFGGIGARRGPGERKLEIDQRRIRDRITQLDKEIEQVRRHRQVLNQRRSESGKPLIAIVGYTNAGKSTLLNRITESPAVYADDKLFATLDPTTRRAKLPGGRIVLFTDTVGFIDKLPHALVAAFRATLEEITRANCILHVIDVSHEDYQKQSQVVLKVLKELRAAHIPVLPVYNKVDVLTVEQRKKLSRHDGILVSARTGYGMDMLLGSIEKIVTPSLHPHQVMLSYRRLQYLPKIFELAVVRRQDYTEKGIMIYLESTQNHWAKIRALARSGETAEVK